MILVCITMMISDAEHFHGLVGYLYVFFKKCLLECSAYFLIWYFLLLTFVIPSYVLRLNSLSDIIGKYFLSSHSLPFHFVNGCLCCAEASKFNAITVVYFWCSVFVFHVKTSLPRLMSRSFSPKCSSNNFRSNTWYHYFFLACIFHSIQNENILMGSRSNLIINGTYSYGAF